VLLNAAAALVAAGEGSGGGVDDLSMGLVDRFHAGLATAARSVDSGAAADLLDRWVAASAS
jgi:anthranilate phosphoribosyltransferase